jgi:hypothetical protein
MRCAAQDLARVMARIFEAVPPDVMIPEALVGIPIK